MKLLHVVGARPNYMKIAPIMVAASQHDRFSQVLVHTGQHYDEKMSDIFFSELKLTNPDYYLGVGSGSHAQQTAKIMIAFEPIIERENPDLLLVAGDVNSTLACALVAVKLGVPVAHVEAGLRSFDWTMPEEINRILTDRISSILFAPSQDAVHNLISEGVDASKIAFVGNVMIDTLVSLLPQTIDRWRKLQESLKLEKYVLVTLHRPSNVDSPKQLLEIFDALRSLSESWKVIFPVHPRTRQRLELFELPQSDNLILSEPLGYLDFLTLERNAALVITDSGGVQEETSYLGVPCLTVRENTERPITILQGTNQLVKPLKNKILSTALPILNSESHSRVCEIEFWDGKASERIVDFLLKL